MREITMGDAIQEAITEEMRRDERVYTLGYAVGPHAGSITRPLTSVYNEFGPERIRETGIIETMIGGSSVGAALAGMRPIADFSTADFMFPALTEILGYGGMWRYEHGGADGMTIPVVFRAAMRTYGGGAAEHSRAPIALFWHAPGLKLALPSTPYDAKGLMKTAIRDDNPVVFLEPARLYQIKGPVPEEEYLVPFGKANVRKEGKDVTLVGIGYSVALCLQAAETLEKEGIQAEVIDLRTVDPPHAIRILEQQGLVEVAGDRVHLTPPGETRAREIIRRHRLAERLLVDLFELGEASLEATACQFEHILSPEVTDNVCTLLGHPPLCPHGRPIPRGACCARLRRDVRPVVLPLNDLPAGMTARLVFITPQAYAQIDRLSTLGLVPGAEIWLRQKRPAYVLRVGQTDLALDSSVARDLYVRPLERPAQA